MPVMFRWVGALRLFLILMALLTAIFVPVVVSGYLEVSQGETAAAHQQYGSAAEYYRSAALKLPWKTGLWEQVAVVEVRAGNAAAAIPIYESLRRHGLLSASGWEIYGAIYNAKGDTQESLNTWLAGFSAYPSHMRFCYLISAAYGQLGEFRAQRAWLERWVATGHADAPDHFGLGLLLMTTDPAGARLQLTQAASMDAAFKPAVRTLDASLDLAAAQPDVSRRLVILGRGLGLVSQWPLAAAAFEQAVQADGANGEAWAWLGEARQQAGQDGKQPLDQALALSPKDTLVHALRGLYWKRQADYQQALAEYRTAAELEPANPEWQAALGDSYTLAGDLVSALAAYRQATTLAPQSVTYWRLLALFCADNSVQVLDVGLPAAKQAAELAPNDPDVLDALGWSFAQAGLLYNAEQTLIKATDLAPRSALAHFHLAETFLLKGDQASALRELTLTNQLDPEGPTGKLAGQIIKQYFP